MYYALNHFTTELEWRLEEGDKSEESPVTKWSLARTEEDVRRVIHITIYYVMGLPVGKSRMLQQSCRKEDWS